MTELARRPIYLAAFIIIIGIALSTRLVDLTTFQTADEKRWGANIYGFTSHLAHGEFDNLLQLPHPGLTLQWLTAPGIGPNGTLGHLKLSLGIAHCVLLVVTFYVFKQLWGQGAATIVMLLLSLNPLLIAHSRVLAMDALLGHFFLLSIALVLLWQRSQATRYLLFAAIASALAWLSKLPGLLLIPLSIGLIITFGYQAKQTKITIMQNLGLWIIVFMSTTILVFPSLLTNFTNVSEELLSFFSSGDYTQLHQSGPTYYLRSLLFFSTPLQLFLPILVIITWPHLSKSQRYQAVVFLLAAILFLIMMSIGAKKGDRYILPVFMLLETVVALIITQLAHRKKLGLLFAAAFIILQMASLPRLHPYYLAYVNPITKPFFDLRRLGWGEGLDLAATYLNQKANADQLTVASYYPQEFQNYFVGEAVPLHQWDSGSNDYAILYRAQLERGPEAWETDVWNQFQDRQPEKVIRLNNIEYVWIYAL